LVETSPQHRRRLSVVLSGTEHDDRVGITAVRDPRGAPDLDERDAEVEDAEDPEGAREEQDPPGPRPRDPHRLEAVPCRSEPPDGLVAAEQLERLEQRQAL